MPGVKTSRRTSSTAKGSSAKKGHLLVHASPGQHFWVCSGAVLGNLRSLQNAFESKMSDADYAYHANRQRNDFAKWVNEVLKDPACAAALRKTKNRHEAAKAVAASLKRYSL